MNKPPEGENGRIRVEVAYADDGGQHIRSLAVTPGTTAWEAVLSSGLAHDIPGVSEENRLACFGRPIGHDSPVQDCDRIEILRPLRADPKEWRRQRAARAVKRAGRPGKPA